MNFAERHLAALLFRHWWVLLLRGLVAIAFGALTWFQPGDLAALVLLFGAYSMADGILGVSIAIAGPKEHEFRWVLLLEGLLGIGVGVLTLFAPGVTTVFALLFYIAVWAIATGVLEIVAAIRLRKEIEGEWLLILGGLASVVFGVLLMAQPGAGVLALLWLIATYAVVFGVLLVMLALKARSFGRQAARS
jgi:uncharacterized membrane protein HdeD (DUF308 family)